MSMTPIEQDTSVIVLPDKWIVANSGTVKSVTFSDAPVLRACLNVTGIVAADDCVPSAVKYAGAIVFIKNERIRFESVPATVY